MRCLLDTCILLWTSTGSSRLPPEVKELLIRPDVQVYFSAASIWEVAIKHARGMADFDADPDLLRSELLANRFIELPITGRHGAAVSRLPMHHKDPFDRILIAQAMVEGMKLLTVDAKIGLYRSSVQIF